MNDKIRVLYDQEGLEAPYSGVACYFLEIMRNFDPEIEVVYGQVETINPELAKPPYSIPLSAHTINQFLPAIDFKGKRKLYNLLSRRLKVIPYCFEINDRFFRESVENSEFDLLHLTGAHIYGHAWKQAVGHKPIIITMHDLIPEIVNRDRQQEIARRRMLDCVDHVLCVSDSTRRDLCAYYQFPKEKTTVIYHGAIEKTGQRECLLVQDKKYILYVGRRNAYKHFNWFVKALSPYLKTHPDLRLVCTGPDFSSDEIETQKALGIHSQVIHYFAPAEEMSSLYAHAEVFVYPSVYEGFGIPILDAFSAGCPVLLSNKSCFPEVAGDAAHYFDPEVEEDFVDKLSQILENRTLRSSLVTRGYERVRRFSWKKAADETASVYRQVVAEWKFKSGRGGVICG